MSDTLPVSMDITRNWVVDTNGVVRVDDMVNNLKADAPENEWVAVGLEDADGFAECVAYCHPVNAPKISAVPDLMAACQYVIDWHRAHDSGEGELFGQDFVTTCISAMRKAKAAITVAVHPLEQDKKLGEIAFANQLWIDGTSENGDYQGDALNWPWVVLDITAQKNIAGPFTYASEALQALREILTKRGIPIP